jgi:DHA1 family inner membrane transport protein
MSGAVLMGLQLAIVAFGPPWQLQAGNFILMGWGFYMIHGSLQVFASELSVEARATALSLHSFFFFMGQTIGPIAYGFGILNVGKIPDLAGERGCNHRARHGLRAAAAADEARRRGNNLVP